MTSPVRIPTFVALVVIGAILMASCLSGEPWSGDDVSADSTGSNPIDPLSLPDVFTGYVEDVEGLGLPDVLVSINDGPSATSGPDGKFEVRFTASSVNTMTIDRDGYTVVTSPFGDAVVDGEYNIDLTKFGTSGTYSMSSDTPIIMLRETMDVTGTVNSTDSYPVNNANVTISGSDGFTSTTTSNSSGAYVLKNVPYGTYTISVHCAGYEDAEITYNPKTSTGNISLTPSKITVSGYVCDSDGSPLGEVNIVVNNSIDTLSDSDGKFSIAFTRSNYDTISFQLDGYSVIAGGLSNVLTKEGNVYRISLDSAIRGTDGYTIVVSTTDNPLMMNQVVSEYHGRISSTEDGRIYYVSGATVEFRDGNNTYSCITDSTGYYSLSCPAYASYTAYVSKTGYADTSIPVIGNHTDISITPSEIVIYGLVEHYNENGLIVPLQGASVEVNGGTKQTTGADGTFSIKFMMKQTNTLTLYLTGYKINVGGLNGVLSGNDGEYVINLDMAKKDSSGRYVVSDEEHPFLLSKTSVTFSGVVTSTSNGETIALYNALVSLTSSEGNTLVTYTDENGKYMLMCGYGTYIMNVECNGFHSYGPKEVSADQPVNNIVMQPHDSSLFFGLDLPHSMMFLGLVLLGMTILVGLLIYMLSKKKIASITTENDLEDDSEE